MFVLLSNSLIMKKILVLTSAILLAVGSLWSQTTPTIQWKSSEFKTDWTERVWKFDVSNFVKGSNTITFTYTHGSHRLCLKDAVVWADGAMIFTDSTEYSAGGNPKTFVYTFNLDTVPTTLTLTAHARTSGGTDSNGLIYLNGYLIIPEGTLEIKGSAFYGDNSLKKVVIPSTVQKIGGLAFHSCMNLTAVVIPSSVASIGDAVFQNCPSLTSATIGEGLWELSYRMFKISGLTEITIPGNIKVIGKEAFQDCASLKKVVLEDGVEEIGTNAFYASRIKSVNIPATVVSIGSLAFHSCVELESVTIPNSVTDVGDAAFQNCKSLATATIGGSMQKINYRLFKASGLTKITIPGNIRVIEKEAFQDCKYLKKVVIESGVEEIGDNAFNNSAVEELVVPRSVKTFGKKIATDKAVWVVDWGSDAFFYALNNDYRIRFRSDAEKDIVAQIIAESGTVAPASTVEWKAGEFSANYVRRKWDFSEALSKPGKYIITFKYTKGACRLCLSDALFTADGKPISYNPDVYSAGNSNPRQITYEITVPEGAKSLVLYALVKTSDGTDSYGTISVEYQDNDGNATAVDESVAGLKIRAEGRTIVVENTDAEIRVYDVMGRLVGAMSATINVEKSGIYIVRAGRESKRIFVE